MLTYIKIATVWSVFVSIPLLYTAHTAPSLFEYAGHVYTVHYGNYDWCRARVVCHREGGDLIEIGSEDTQEAVKQALQSQDIETDGFWIGLTIVTEERSIGVKWVSGQDIHYTNYLPEMNDLRLEGCYMMRADNFTWQMFRCYNIQHQFSFICQNNSAKDILVPYMTGVTTDNVTDIYPGLYFEINVELFLPFGTPPGLLCVQVANSWSPENVNIYVFTDSVFVGKNIHISTERLKLDLLQTDTAPEAEDNNYFPDKITSKFYFCLAYVVKNQTGTETENFIRIPFGVLIRKVLECSYDTILFPSLRYENHTRDEIYMYFPLVYSCINKPMNITKVAFFDISSPSSIPLVKGNILTITINAYIPYFYPQITIEVSNVVSNSTVVHPLWLKLDQVGWNYKANSFENMEVTTCFAESALVLKLPNDMANRGILLSPNTTENDLVRFTAFVYLAEYAQDNTSYSLSVRIFTKKSETESEKLEKRINISAKNLTNDNYVNMVANLSLVSFIEDDDVRSNTTNLTIVAETVQNWVLSYYILLFLDIDTPKTAVDFINVSVKEVKRNLNCESVNMLLLETSDISNEAQRKDLAVVQMSVSNVYNVSADENDITLSVSVVLESRRTQINVVFITPDGYEILRSNQTNFIEAFDESCGNSSNTLKTYFHRIVYSYVVVILFYQIIVAK